jgi:hypothetical protein
MDNSISTRRWKIDKARRDKMQELMAEYDENIYRPARKKLTEDCASNKGHNWFFVDTNPLGLPIFRCSGCGTSHIGELETARAALAGKKKDD